MKTGFQGELDGWVSQGKKKKLSSHGNHYEKGIVLKVDEVCTKPVFPGLLPGLPDNTCRLRKEKRKRELAILVLRSIEILLVFLSFYPLVKFTLLVTRFHLCERIGKEVKIISYSISSGTEGVSSVERFIFGSMACLSS